MSSQRHNLPANTRILAAVSGGADSVYLVYKLLEEFSPPGHEIAIAHVNHGTRGAESDCDEKFVQEVADKLELPCYIQRVDLNLVQTKGNKKNESNLRAMRLGLLKSLAQSLGFGAIAFGHHRDDLAETFLINALRGSGPAGLEGMRALRRIPGTELFALRPLLGMRRSEIEDALRVKNQDWRTDESNADTSYRRNALRHDVLPMMENIEPGAVENLAHSAELCGAMMNYYQEACKNALDEAVRDRSETAVLIDSQTIRSLPHADVLIPGIVRQLIADLLVNEQRDIPVVPNRDTMAKMTRRMLEQSVAPAEFQVSDSISVYIDNSYTIIYRSEATLFCAFESVSRGLPCIVAPDDFCEPIREKIEVGSWKLSFRQTSREEPSLDIDTRPSPSIETSIPMHQLVLRRLDRKERIALPGGGSKSVEDALQEKGIPHPLRNNIAGVCHGNDILWIPGIRRSPLAQPDPGASKVFYLTIE